MVLSPAVPPYGNIPGQWIVVVNINTALTQSPNALPQSVLARPVGEGYKPRNDQTWEK